jgi:hypothetical protein
MSISQDMSIYNSDVAFKKSQDADVDKSIHDLLKAWKEGKVSAQYAIFMFMLSCMPQIISSSESDIKIQADALNVATDVRQKITNAQNIYNKLVEAIKNKDEANGKLYEKQLNEALDSLNQDLSTTGIDQVLTEEGINSLKGFIDSLKTSGGSPNFYQTLYNAYWDHNQSNTVFQNITSDFTSMNQSVSGISSQIQAEMSYLNQAIQQYYSVYKSMMDSESNLSQYIIQHSSRN